MNDTQKRISIGQAINIAKDIVLATTDTLNNREFPPEKVIDMIAGLVPQVIDKLSVERFMKEENSKIEGLNSLIEGLKNSKSKEATIDYRNKVLESIQSLSEEDKEKLRAAFIDHLKTFNN